MAERLLSRRQLITHFAERFGLSRQEAERFFDELQSLAERELKRAGEFEIPGVAKFVVRQRQARTGRNPQTGAPVSIPARTVVKARIATHLKRQAYAGDETSIPPPQPPIKSAG